MKICVIGDPHGKIPKNLPEKNIDLILITGDLGKSDLARQLYLNKKEKPPVKKKEKAYREIYFSTIKLLKTLSKKAMVYTIMGNVGRNWSELLRRIKELKRVEVVKNSLRNIGGVRVGFLEYFTDNSWIKEFNEKDKKKILKAGKTTKKAKRVLKRFGEVDILICHQPPYGILDKVGGKAPKEWRGKHAGSKVILDYVRRFQPKYVFCGHIHEGKGQKMVGKTRVYNLGIASNVVVNF